MFEDGWKDATVVGSAYEQQTNLRGNWRHRPLTLSNTDSLGRDRKCWVGFGDWIGGPAPDFDGPS